MELGIILVSLVVTLLLKSNKLKSMFFCCAFFTKKNVVKEVNYAY